MSVISYRTERPEETEEIGANLIKNFSAPVFIAIFGDLGAGKTALVRGMVKSFDPLATVTSPTYNFFNTYKRGTESVYHFDMYRITDEEDLYSIGFYDCVDDGIVITEWSENIPYAIPKQHIKIEIIKTGSPDERIINVEYNL